MKTYKASVLYSTDKGGRTEWRGTVSARDRAQGEALAVQAAAKQADPHRLTRWSVVLKEHKTTKQVRHG
jgi:hypothetical protein